MAKKDKEKRKDFFKVPKQFLYVLAGTLLMAILAIAFAEAIAIYALVIALIIKFVA